VNDWLLDRAGLMLQYAYLKNTLRSHNTVFSGGRPMEYKGDSFGVGGGAGILVEPRKGTRLGLTYMSPVQQEFKDTPGIFQRRQPRQSDAGRRTAR